MSAPPDWFEPARGSAMTGGAGATAVPSRRAARARGARAAGPRFVPGFSRTRGLVGSIIALADADARYRRAMIVAMVGACILAAIGCAAGVISLNNVILTRSVELGRLDEARRTYRTDNARMSAEIARLSAPPRIVTQAKRKLGMQTAGEMATFIGLNPHERVRANGKRKRDDAAGTTPAAGVEVATPGDATDTLVQDDGQ